MKPYYEDDSVTIFHGDCREVLPGVPEVSLIVADPPYNGVLSDEWDNLWCNDDTFLEWLNGVVCEMCSRLTDNGTLYVWCWSTLVGRVESVVRAHANPISSIVWDKGASRSGGARSGVDVTSLRSYWPSERCVVAEMMPRRWQDADSAAREESGYWSACQAAKTSIIGDYLRGELDRAAVSRQEIATLFPSRTGGLTGCVSNWILGHNVPTAEQYAAIRAYLNGRGRGTYLRREYEDLRREYEDLRREYEDLRRPFFLTASHQWGDVWRFPVPSRRVHPAQKPAAMMEQIVAVSSRESDLVLDPFMGSGTTLVAAKNLGRKAIGIEIEERYCEIAAQRCSQEVLAL